ncbi:MAG: carbamoyl phosphate synthase small subunit, partial [Rhodospirillaceae bacterium]|nr:carbamoyl phosphate synthase small subunit [Rhodospirillaceae bacterium]
MAKAHKENAPLDEGTILSSRPPSRPDGCNAAIVLASGEVFWGRGAGALGVAVGEVCFNTAMTGYQ